MRCAAWLAACLAVAATAHANATFPLPLGSGEPWGVAADRSGDIWFAAPGCDFAPRCQGDPDVPGQIGELKRSRRRVVLYALPPVPGNQPAFVAFDRRGRLWFTTPDNDRIGAFDPARRRFVGQWPVTAGSGPWDLAFAGGAIWYTEAFGSAIGSFDPATHRHRDFPTPSADSRPYGIAADRSRIWFTENNPAVDRVGVLDSDRHDAIREYPIVLPPDGTPHMIAIGPRGHPWWTEGFSATIATLNPALATPGSCGTAAGTCAGVRRFALPRSTACPLFPHASGIAFDRARRVLWVDDSLGAQVGSFSPSRPAFRLTQLPDCNAHPHDGLVVGPRGVVWFDEEFGAAIGRLVP